MTNAAAISLILKSRRIPELASRSSIMPICNICGHDRFVPGPFGRLSRGGLAPRCARCRSLERHRAARQAIDRIREPDLLAELSLIRFSDDPIVDDNWFR